MSKSKEQNDKLYVVEDGSCLDPVCPICGKGSDPTNNDHACRVCGRVYHRECCESDGKYTDFDLSTLDRAFTKVGWSCLECDNVAMSALTPESHMQVSDIFEKYDINDDGSITLDEYLSTCKHVLERDLTEDEHDAEVQHFKKLDRDNSGEIELAEFLAHETSRYLAKYGKEELVSLMTPLEKKGARRMFDLLDTNGDGVIDMWESTQHFGLMGWYRLLERTESMKSMDVLEEVISTRPQLQQRRRSSVVGQNLPPQSLHIRKCDENGDGKVSWPEFLRGHALDIILARPNKSDEAVALL